MNTPKLLYLPCPNPACPSNSAKRGKAKEPVSYIKLTEVVLDSDFQEHGARVLYRCKLCGHEFYRPK